jgi:UDPglucose 6-dehydrogenase
MKLPVIGFVGMTHLGLVSGVSAAEKGFSLVCYDPDTSLIKDLNALKLPVSEPQLVELVTKNKNRIKFTSEIAELQNCDVVYVAPDVSTDDNGQSNLTTINYLLENVFNATRTDTVIVILSQVPPGFTRGKQREGRILYYQVETLIFGRAVERALYPERYIIGCSNPSQPIPRNFQIFLEANKCPLLPMRYESAELAKISINMCLVASVTTANTLAELCESIGADWSEIVPALKLDKRIGQNSYLAPGLGIAGGNLERDLATVCNFADQYGTDAGVVRAWISNSKHRKDWPLRVLHKEVLSKNPNAIIGIWGLAYKQNTNSIKNSPSLALLLAIPESQIRVFDPVVPASVVPNKKHVAAISELDACLGVDVLIVMTPWEQFSKILPNDIFNKMRGNLILDPYNVLNKSELIKLGFKYLTLGVSN